MMLQANFLSFTDITYVPVCSSTGRVERADIVSAIKANTVMLQANILSFTDITYVPVCSSTGRVEASNIVSAIKANTVMVTVMLANNETGIVQVSQ